MVNCRWVVKISENGTILNVDGVEYDLAPGLNTLIVQKHPRPNQWTSGDYQAYKYLSIQTKVRSHLNPRGVARPRSTSKYKHMLRKMIVPGESIVEEESEDSEDSVAGECTDSSSPPIKPGLFTKSTSEPPSPAHTRSCGKARKTKDREAFYKGWKGDGVVYLPGDINGFAKKLQLLAAEFFAGNTTVRNELVHVLDALLRLKQLTRKEYTNITARLVVRLYTRVDALQ